MKKYTLASPEARKNVDLRNHSDIIIKAVHDVVPNAVVDVYEEVDAERSEPIEENSIFTFIFDLVAILKNLFNFIFSFVNV